MSTSLPFQRLVLRLNRQTELGAPLCVLVTVVHYGVFRQLAKMGQSSMHFFRCTLKEPPTASQEERIAIVS